MNKTKIDWPWKPLYTWNPITGCKHGCPYCYARKIAMRFDGHFKPTFHEERINEPEEHKKPRNIFVGSMADMFGDFIPETWIDRMLSSCLNAPQHTYIFLTKNPKRYLDFDFKPISCSLGLTITGEISCLTAVKYGLLLKKHKQENQTIFLSIEPLLGGIGKVADEVALIIVGAMSGTGAVKPKKEWIDSIKHHNVYYKNSMKEYLK